MNNNKVMSNIEIINKGYLWVNIPAIIIILIVWFLLIAFVELNGKISAIIGGIVSWVYWEFTIIKWIKWALDKNVDPERLLKIGKLSLLLWDRKKIDKVLNYKR